MTITTHPVTASVDGTAFLAIGVQPGASAPLLIVAMVSMYAILAYLPYADHLLRARPALARPTCEAVRQPDCVVILLESTPGPLPVETVMLARHTNDQVFFRVEFRVSRNLTRLFFVLYN